MQVFFFFFGFLGQKELFSMIEDILQSTGYFYFSGKNIQNLYKLFLSMSEHSENFHFFCQNKFSNSIFITLEILNGNWGIIHTHFQTYNSINEDFAIL